MVVPRVSVVMPLRNAEATVRAAVASILDQTLPDLELLAIDDGSTDGTGRLLGEMAAGDARLLVHHRPMQGIVDALNWGLEHARAEYVARMDADDVSGPSRLQEQVEYLEARPETGVLSCRVRYGGCPDRQAGYGAHVAWANAVMSEDDILMTRFVESSLPHPSVLFRRDLVARHGGYRDGPFPEDYDLWLRWMEEGVKFAKLDRELVRWNDPPDRLSRKDDRYDPEAFYGHKAEFLARWLARNNPRHPDLVVWGAGRTSRRRAEELVRHGCRITAYVDIDPRKVGQRIAGRPVWSPEDLPAPGACYVVPYVGARGARSLIEDDLRGRGYVRGRDYICAA